MSDPRRTLADLSDCVIDRRRFIAYTGALAGTALYAQLRGDLALAAPKLNGYPFRLGVASGDPSSNGVSLWTRLAPKPLEPDGGMEGPRVAVTWEAASADASRTIVKQGRATAAAELGGPIPDEALVLRPR